MFVSFHNCYCVSHHYCVYVASSEEISLYRKELASIHFNCKTRPATGTMRGTEVCIPNVFPPPDVSGVLGELGFV